MWVFYRAVRYIDAGFEAIHFGQVEATGNQDPNRGPVNDPGGRHWWSVLARIREFAAGQNGSIQAGKKLILKAGELTMQAKSIQGKADSTVELVGEKL